MAVFRAMCLTVLLGGLWSQSGAQDPVYQIGSRNISAGGEDTFTLPLSIVRFTQNDPIVGITVEVIYDAGEVAYEGFSQSLGAEAVWEIQDVSDDEAGTLTLSLRPIGGNMLNQWDPILDLHFSIIGDDGDEETTLEIQDMNSALTQTIVVYHSDPLEIFPDADPNGEFNLADVTNIFSQVETESVYSQLQVGGSNRTVPLSISNLTHVFQHLVGLRPALTEASFGFKEAEDLAVSEVLISDPQSIGGDFYAYTFTLPGQDSLLSVDILLDLDPDVIEAVQTVSPVNSGNLIRGRVEGENGYRVQMAGYLQREADSSGLFHVVAKHQTGISTGGISLSTTRDLEILTNPAGGADRHLTMYSNEVDVESVVVNLDLPGFFLAGNFVFPRGEGWEFRAGSHPLYIQIFNARGALVWSAGIESYQTRQMSPRDLPRGAFIGRARSQSAVQVFKIRR